MFADGAGLFGALLSVWEGVEPAGMTGGNLRREFAAGLTEAAALLDEPGLGHEAVRWLEIAELWHALAETAVPTSVPACAQGPGTHRGRDRRGRGGRRRPDRPGCGGAESSGRCATATLPSRRSVPMRSLRSWPA